MLDFNPLDSLGALESIFKMKYKFLQYEDYFQEYLINKNGLIKISHPFMEEAIKIRYLKEDKMKRKFREKIIEELMDHIETKDSTSNNNRIEEIAYQYLMLKDYDTLNYFIHDDVPNQYLVQNCPELYEKILVEIRNNGY